MFFLPSSNCTVFMAAVDQCGAMLVLDMCTHLALSCTVATSFIKMFKYGNICGQTPFSTLSKLSNRQSAWCECSSIFSRSHAIKWRHIAIHAKDWKKRSTPVWTRPNRGTTVKNITRRWWSRRGAKTSRLQARQGHVFGRGLWAHVCSCSHRSIWDVSLGHVLCRLNSWINSHEHDQGANWPLFWRRTRTTTWRGENLIVHRRFVYACAHQMQRVTLLFTWPFVLDLH